MIPLKCYYKSTIKPYYEAIKRLLWPFDDYCPYPPLATTIMRYVQFLRDLRSYYKMPGAEKFDFRWINPFINDKYSSAGDIGQYFYQDIWALKRIQGTRPNYHVDLGSRMIFVGMLTTITRVIFIDVRPIVCDLSNVETKIGDITNMPYPDDSVPSLSCLHTAEHIGLGRYGDKLSPKGTEKAVAELIRVLSPNGNLFFSVPVGKNERVFFNSHRLYSISTILKMFSMLNIVELSGIDEHGHFIENIEPEVFDKVERLSGGLCLLWLKKPT